MSYTIVRGDDVNYLSVAEIAERWAVSERSVRNYCAEGRIDGAFLTGKTWNIPETAVKPERKNANVKTPETLLEILIDEKKNGRKGGIYHKIQVDMTYNSNHIEGSRLTHDQTRYIYETNTIGFENASVNVDDIMETVNHFRCIDIVIESVGKTLSERLIKELHKTMKSGTSDSRKDWFAVGAYKKLPNEVGGMKTTLPQNVADQMKALVDRYNSQTTHTLDDIIEFHYEFECIHPFQDGNGRVGRLIMFRECLKNDIVPFILSEDLKLFYYRGLKEWRSERGYLTDTILTAQDRFKAYLDYFKIKYKEV
jgi:Fic family protein